MCCLLLSAGLAHAVEADVLPREEAAETYVGTNPEATPSVMIVPVARSEPDRPQGNRPPAGDWLQAAEPDRAERAEQIARAKTEAVAAADPGGDYGSLAFLGLIIVATGGGLMFIFRRSLIRPPAPRPKQPGEGTRVTFAGDDRRRYSQAGTSIIERTTAFFRRR